MNTLDLIRTRRSPLELGPPAPSADVLSAIFECAAAAPDHGRIRPWRFITIEGAALHAFGHLLALSLARRRPDASGEMLEKEAAKAMRAPLIIVAAAVCDPESRVRAVEQILSAGAATQNIILASIAAGFNAVWKTGDAAYDAEVKRALGLDEHNIIVGFLYVGTEGRKLPPRAPSEQSDLVRSWTGPLETGSIGSFAEG